MPPIPPTHLILSTLQEYALPAAGGAALTFALFLTLGRWAAALGSAAAIVVGYAWANFTFGALAWEGTTRLIPWKPEGPAWHLLPRAALVLVVVGLVSRWLALLVGIRLHERAWWMKNLLVWLPRWVAILIVGSWVIPAPFADAYPWIKPALGTAMLLSWITLDGTARAGASSQATLALAAPFLAASGVAIYAHSMRFMDVAVVMGYAMLGVALVARAAKVDASGAIPAGIGMLPALMLNVFYQTQADSKVPFAAFCLVGLAPLAWLPLLIPRVARQNRWLLMAARFVLLMIPLAIAVGLAMHYEDLPPDEEEEMT